MSRHKSKKRGQRRRLADMSKPRDGKKRIRQRNNDLRLIRRSHRFNVIGSMPPMGNRNDS
jgi:hypothetical protein